MTLQGLFLFSSVIILFLMNIGYLLENSALKEQLKKKQKRTVTRKGE